MFVASGCNTYLHLRIEKISEYYNKNLEEDVLVIKGRNVTRQLSENYSRFVVNNSPLLLIVRGFLREYVKNELETGDNIFVVGYITGRFDGTKTTMAVRAEAIYKEDFLHYFPQEIQQKGMIE